MLWGRPPHDFTKASVFVLTKHARKITMDRAGLTPSKFFWPAPARVKIRNYLKKRPRGLALGHREMGVFLTHPPRCRAPPACWKWSPPAPISHPVNNILWAGSPPAQLLLHCLQWVEYKSHLFTHVVSISTINIGANAIIICFRAAVA